MTLPSCIFKDPKAFIFNKTQTAGDWRKNKVQGAWALSQIFSSVACSLPCHKSLSIPPHRTTAPALSHAIYSYITGIGSKQLAHCTERSPSPALPAAHPHSTTCAGCALSCNSNSYASVCCLFLFTGDILPDCINFSHTLCSSLYYTAHGTAGHAIMNPACV